MWCGKYKNKTTLVTECNRKGCIMCEYCEPEDGEEEAYDYQRAKSKSDMQRSQA